MIPDSCRNVAKKANKLRRPCSKDNDEKDNLINKDIPSKQKFGRKLKNCVHGVFCSEIEGKEQMEIDVRQTRPPHQKSLQTETTVPAFKGFAPRFRTRHEWRYNSVRWATVSAFCYAIEEMCYMSKETVNTTKPKKNTIFHAAIVPDISLSEYLRRIAWFYNCSKECFVLALEYIHRVTKYKPEVEVNYHTAHHLILTCIQVASKFFDDAVFNNILYSKVVGVPTTTISAFEIHLLFLLSFDLYVVPKQYVRRYNKMLVNNKGQNKVTLKSG